MSATLWPKAYGEGPVMTPMRDTDRDIEWWRTQHALGRPVDINALFEIIANIEGGYEEKMGEKDKERKKLRDNLDLIESENITLCEAIDEADRKLDTARSRVFEEILGKLNRIDRYHVAKVLKDIRDDIDKVQKDLLKAKRA